MNNFIRARWLALLVPVALLGGAYGSQLIGGLYPCEMCWWQRYPHFVAIPFALIAFFIGNPAVQRSFVALAALAILTSGLIGGYHAGVAYGWWEGLTKCSSTAVGTGEDLLKSIMNAPLVRCDAAPWKLFGISLAGYNFLISTGSALITLWLISRNKSA